MEKNYLHKKLCYNNKVGTVRYQGPLHGRVGIWLGVEWDDPAIGFHDGKYDNKRYFQTKHDKNGSFLNMSKIPLNCFGVNCDGALRKNYKSHETVLEANMCISNRLVNYVGFEKVANVQRNFELLSVVILKNSAINCDLQNNHTNLAKIAPNISQLDISSNLNTSFDQILHIVNDLNKLRTLDISNNPLMFPQLPYSGSIYPSVSILYANQLNMNWSEVAYLFSIFPNIKEIHIGQNPLNHDTIPTFVEMVKPLKIHLEHLDLSRNENIVDWALDLDPLHNVFPNLMHLNLSSSNITSIEYSSHLHQFEHLQALFLDKCNIKDWDFIGCLKLICPNLTHVRLSGNPVMEKELPTKQTIKSIPNATLQTYSNSLSVLALIAIAILPSSLQVFNGVHLTSTDKHDADITFLNHFHEFIEFFSMTNEFKENSLKTLYVLLCEKYDRPLEPKTELAQTRAKQNFVNITFVFNGTKISKSIPRDTTVARLKTIYKTIFATQTTTDWKKMRKFDLILLDPNRPGFPITLTQPQTTIDYYGVDDDYEIYFTQ